MAGDIDKRVNTDLRPEYLADRTHRVNPADRDRG